MQASVAKAQTVNAASVYLKYVRQCIEDRSEVAGTIERFIQLASDLDLDNPVRANQHCAELTRLNMEIQFDAEEYNETHQFQSKTELACEITEQLSLLAAGVRQLQRKQRAERQFSVGINSSNLDEFVRSRVALETEDQFAKLQKR